MSDKVVQDEFGASTESSATGTKKLIITQPNHGFVVSDYPLPAYIEKATADVKLAKADSANTLKVFYITNVIDSNTFEVTANFYEVTNGHTLALYEYHFLSDVIAGGVALNPATFDDVAFYAFSPTQLILVDNRSIEINPPTNGGSDEDWHKQGTTDAPSDINDDKETGGELKLKNYGNVSRDDGQTPNFLNTDNQGNLKSSFILPHIILNDFTFEALRDSQAVTQISTHKFVKDQTPLKGNLTLFNNTAFNTNENFREYEIPLFEPVDQVSALDGYIYLISQTGEAVYIFNPNTRKIEHTIGTGVTGNFNRHATYNPVTNKIYSLNSAGTRLFIYDISTRFANVYTVKSAVSGGNIAYRYAYGGTPSLDYHYLYYVPYSGNQILKFDLLGIEDSLGGNHDTTIAIPTAFSYANNIRWAGARIARNGAIYGTPTATNVWLKIDTLNGDAISTFPALAGSTTFNRGMLSYTNIDPTGTYLLSGWAQPGNTPGLTNASIRGVVQRVDTDNDDIDYVTYPNGLNHVTTGYWGTVGGFCLGIDGLLYQAPLRNVGSNDWCHVLDPDTFATIEQFDGASNFGYKTPITAMNGKMYAFQQYAPYGKVLEIHPIGEIKHDPERIILISKAI